MKPFDEVASFGRRIRVLKDLIEKQVGESARDAGSKVKASALSPLLLLHEHGQLTTADIAAMLDDSHQLTSQRITWLHENGFVEITDSEEDLRQRMNSLTRAGKKEARLLEKYAENLNEAYLELFDQIGINALEAIEKTYNALKSHSLSERIRR